MYSIKVVKRGGESGGAFLCTHYTYSVVTPNSPAHRDPSIAAPVGVTMEIAMLEGGRKVFKVIRLPEDGEEIFVSSTDTGKTIDTYRCPQPKGAS